MIILSQFFNKRISTPVWIFIILLFTLLSEGFLIWQCKIGPKEEVKIPEIKRPEKEAEGEIADWKTYRNEERGFVIEYPGNWKAETSFMVFGENELLSSVVLSEESPTENLNFSLGIDIWADNPIMGCDLGGEEITVEGIKTYPTICIIGDGNFVFLDMCFDENLEYMGNYCPEHHTGPGVRAGDYYQFGLYCEGEKWKGRVGKNQCNQLFNSIISTFRFLQKEEEAITSFEELEIKEVEEIRDREVAFLQGGDIWVLSRDMKNKAKLVDTEDSIIDFSFSPDGKEIYLLNDKGEIWKQEGGEEPIVLVSVEQDMEEAIQETWGLSEPFSYMKGKVLGFWLSPDGNYIAYTTLEEHTI